MGRPRTLLALAVIILASARAAQRREAKQPAHQPGSAPAAQTPPADNTNATGRVVNFWTMIGTVLAGVAALAALVISTMTFILQRQQNDDQQQRRDAGFASKVTWWTERTGQDQIILAIQNSGYEPMPAFIKLHNVLVDPDSPSSKPYIQTKSSQMEIGALLPCSISRLKLHVQSRGPGPRVVPGVDHITVIDPTGRAWSRKPSGQLIRAEVPTAGPHQIELDMDPGTDIVVESDERSVTPTSHLSRISAPYCSGPAD